MTHDTTTSRSPFYLPLFTISLVLCYSFYYSSCYCSFFFFFFSSRRRHTRSDRDWSSDVCSSDLDRPAGRGLLHFIGRDTARPLNAWTRRRIFPGAYAPTLAEVTTEIIEPARSEERRVGKECRSRWSPYH